MIINTTNYPIALPFIIYNLHSSFYVPKSSTAYQIRSQIAAVQAYTSALYCKGCYVKQLISYKGKPNSRASKFSVFHSVKLQKRFIGVPYTLGDIDHT